MLENSSLKISIFCSNCFIFLRPLDLAPAMLVIVTKKKTAENMSIHREFYARTVLYKIAKISGSRTALFASKAIINDFFLEFFSNEAAQKAEE